MVKLNSFIYGFAVIFAFGVVNLSTYAQSALEEVYRFQGDMANPSHFFVFEGDVAIIVDRVRREHALSKVRMPDGTVYGAQRIGEGPGEIAEFGHKYAVSLPDRLIWFWDMGAQQGTVYSEVLEPLHTIRHPSGSMSAMLPLDDSTVATLELFSGDNFATLYTLGEDFEVNRTPVKDIALDSDDALLPISTNPLLKQGPLYTDAGQLFVGFEFSSLIARVGVSGLEYVQGAPANIMLPEERQSGGYAAPDASKHPVGTLDLAVDDDYLYVLHLGETFEIGRMRQFVAMARGQLEAMIEEFETSDRVFVYDRHSGEFITEFVLPVRARRIEATEEGLYVLSIDDMPATIIKYRKPESWE